MRQRPGSVIADASSTSTTTPASAWCGNSACWRAARGFAKETGRHRGVITRTAESVFGAVLYLTEKYGRVFPSLEGLAHLSMCCKQSVVTALADLERLGYAPRGRVSLFVAEVLPPDSYLLPTVLVAVSVVDDGLNANATAAKDSSSRFKASPVRGAHDFRLCRSADQQDAGGE
jgi:hypothetical protein